MAGKLDRYSLGDKGVDLVSTPIHQDPNSWRKLQNAEFATIEGQGGVKKRGALLKLNTSALNSGASIQAVFNMPLETDALDILTTLAYPLDPGSPESGALWRTSIDDGVTWAVELALTHGLAISTQWSGLGQPVGNLSATISGTMYWCSGVAPTFNPGVFSWDGLTQTEVASVFPTINGNDVTNVDSVIAVGVKLYFACSTVAGDHAVYVMEPSLASTLTQVGDLAFGTGVPFDLAYAFGRVWLIVGDAGDTKFYQFQVGGASVWTLDQTVVGYGPTGMLATIDGNLIAGLSPGTGAAGKIYRTTGAGGLWGSVFTAGAAANNQGFYYFANHLTGGSAGAPAIFAFYTNGFFVSGGDTCKAYMSEDDGATWAEDEDFVADFTVDPDATAPGRPALSSTGELFVPFWQIDGSAFGFLAVRTGPATWEQRQTTTAIYPLVAAF